ncbi:DUF5008 domain-containing protein [Mucilaginibacter ximonensis]|uniref:DUF5008 domain-containing protein n=1 Tax=Mucilaginibacter ximonensis TaxID=538021 RepID=A0ABW5YAZ9_9SPHI
MKLRYTGLLAIAAALLVSSCKKPQQIFNNPYADAKAPLGISTDPQQIPQPASGAPGTPVTITATGLEQYKDKLLFLFNGQKAQIQKITSTSITVIVPASASSGITSFSVDGQLVFGPRFTVIGKVNLDPTYNNPVGTDGPVVKAYPIPNSTQMIIMGAFQNYANAGTIVKTNRIVRVFADGSWDRSFQVGAGANSTVYDIAQVGPYYYVVGDFSSFAQQSGNIQRIAKIQTNGLVDTMQVTTYLLKTKYVPTFNIGFAGGTASSVHAVGSNKMIVTGNFTYTTKRNYSANTYDAKDSTIVDSTIVRQLAQVNVDGTLDSNWRFDKTKQGYKFHIGASWTGPNGPIAPTIMDANNKLLVYGRFTSFDDQPANAMIRLNVVDGKPDQTFNIGSGPDQNLIAWVSYNAVLNKYLVVGAFSKFNGVASQYIVRLNYDGSVDGTFTPKVFNGGIPNFAKLLDDGLAVVSGSFRSYDGVIRNGFAVLNSSGGLADLYNNTGNVNGVIEDVYETRSADNKRALLIMGSFSLFDNQVKNNIVRVTFE